MMKCLWIYCILFILLLASAEEQQIIRLATAEVQGKNISISCYDPVVADRYEENFSVYVFFESLNNQCAIDVRIAIYQVFWSKIRNDRLDWQFYGRISFNRSVGNLTLSNIQPADEGTYRCEPSLPLYPLVPPENRAYETELTVYVIPSIIAKKVQDPLVAGDDLEKAATCSAQSGKPAASVRWTDDTHLQHNHTNNRTEASRQIETVTAELYLVPSKFYDKKAFICEITHPAVTETKYLTVVLNVTSEPFQLGTGKLVGIIATVVLVLLVATILIWYGLKRRNEKKGSTKNMIMPTNIHLSEQEVDDKKE